MQWMILRMVCSYLYGQDTNFPREIVCMARQCNTSIELHRIFHQNSSSGKNVMFTSNLKNVQIFNYDAIFGEIVKELVQKYSHF